MSEKTLIGEEAKKKYVERWDEHVNTLQGLGWHLIGDDFMELKEKLEELKKLVRVAAKDVEQVTI
jgi:hypothetical protein